jgi:serine/threonine protein kinase/class 3 adenylate cyclase
MDARRLTTILAADVVGYSKMIECDEEETLARIRAIREMLIVPIVSHFHGRVFKTMGDGFLIEFGSAVNAVKCGLTLQSGLIHWGAEVPEEGRIRLRIGINVGDVIVDGSDLMGDGVNVAARIEGIGEPGEVFVSGTVFDNVDGKTRFDFQFIGEQELKNIRRPVRVFRVRETEEGRSVPYETILTKAPARNVATPIRDQQSDATVLSTSRAAGGLIGIGTVISHTYRVEGVIGRGGMGEVFRARHLELGSEHAIKVILPEHLANPTIVDLYLREASVLREIRHEAIVGSDGFIRDENGSLFLVMEYVDGISLAELMLNGPLSESDLMVLLRRISGGLACAHAKGIVHRDLSPDNVLCPRGQIVEAKLIDFGISKLVEGDGRTIIGNSFAGKISYASPEQLGMFGGNVDPRSDVYSLGLVMAAAGLGTPLDMGTTLAEAVRRRQNVPDLTGVPPRLRAVIEPMLQPDPADRPARAPVDVDATVPLVEATPALSSASRPSPAQLPGSVRNRLPLIAAGVAALGFVGVGAFIYLTPTVSPPPPPAPSSISSPPATALVAATPAPTSPPVFPPAVVAPAGPPPSPPRASPVVTITDPLPPQVIPAPVIAAPILIPTPSPHATAPEVTTPAPVVAVPALTSSPPPAPPVVTITDPLPPQVIPAPVIAAPILIPTPSPRATAPEVTTPAPVVAVPALTPSPPPAFPVLTITDPLPPQVIPAPVIAAPILIPTPSPSPRATAPEVTTPAPVVAVPALTPSPPPASPVVTTPDPTPPQVIPAPEIAAPTRTPARPAPNAVVTTPALASSPVIPAPVITAPTPSPPSAVASPDPSQSQPDQIAAILRPPNPVATLSDIRRLADAHLPASSCGPADVSVSRGGTFLVRGHVASEAQRESALAVLRSDPIGDQLAVTVSVVPAPFCQIAAALRTTIGANSATGIEVTFNQPNLVYREGDELVLMLRGLDGSGAVTVDYVDGTGDVYHLVPSRVQPNGALGVGQTLRIGTTKAASRPGEAVYTISPPFGTSMIIVTRTPAPLFTTPASRTMSKADAYASELLRLREAGRVGTGEGRPVTQMIMFETRPR